MGCVSIDGLFQRWIRFHLAVPRVGSLWGEGKGARTPPAGLRPSFFWEKFCFCRGPAWMPSDTQLSPGESEMSLARRDHQVLKRRRTSFQSWNLQDFSDGPVVKNPPCQCRTHRFHPCSGKIPHASPQGRVAPARCNWRKSLCSNTDLAQPK